MRNQPLRVDAMPLIPRVVGGPDIEVSRNAVTVIHHDGILCRTAMALACAPCEIPRDKSPCGYRSRLRSTVRRLSEQMRTEETASIECVRFFSILPAAPRAFL